jgi:hypothetical protein
MKINGELMVGGLVGLCPVLSTFTRRLSRVRTSRFHKFEESPQD